MSGTPIKKLPTSPSVGLPGISVADRGGEKIDVGLGGFRAASSNEFGNPRCGGASNDLKFSLGDEFHTDPLLHPDGKNVFFSVIFHAI
jgi:hypothetical protein